MWQKFEAWVTTGSGIAATLAGAAALGASVWAFGGRFIGFLKKGVHTIAMHWNFEDYLTKQFDRLEHKFDRLEDRIESVEEGVINGIKVRRDVMEEDRHFAWLEAKPDGRFEWVNRLWYEITGATAEDTLGYGWLNAVAEKERAAVLRDWKSAVAQERTFDRQITLVHTRSLVETRVRLAAGPGRGKPGGKIVLYSGHAVRL